MLILFFCVDYVLTLCWFWSIINTKPTQIILELKMLKENIKKGHAGESLNRANMRKKSVEYIERLLCDIPVGKQLPPIREMMADSGLGRIRLDYAIDVFEKKNILERRPPVGIFKVARYNEMESINCIDVLQCGPTEFNISGSFFVNFMNELSLAATGRHIAIRTHRIRVDGSIEQYYKLLNSHHIQMAVIIHLHNPELLQFLDDNHIKWVSLSPYVNLDFRNTILMPSDVVPLQMEHLIGLGHSRIALMHGVSPGNMPLSLSSQHQDYYRIMAENGYKVEPQWVAFTHWVDTEIFAAWDQIFSSEPYPTAAIVPDPCLSATYRYMERRHIRIGRDFSLIARDDLPVTRELTPQVSSTVNSITDTVNIVLESIETLFSGGTLPETCSISSRLISRDSTGPAPEV